MRSVNRGVARRNLGGSSTGVCTPNAVLLTVCNSKGAVAAVKVISGPDTAGRTYYTLITSPRVYSPLCLFCTLESHHDNLLGLIITKTRQGLDIKAVEGFPVPLRPLRARHRVTEALKTCSSLVRIGQQQVRILGRVAHGLFAR